MNIFQLRSGITIFIFMVNIVMATTNSTITTDVPALYFTPVMFGAKGDGVTDDTDAFNAMDAQLAIAKGPVHVHIPAGIFMVNPLRTPLRELAPGIIRRKCLIWLRNDYSKVTCDGVIKVLKGPDYTTGMKIGTEWYWAAVLIRANYCTVDGLNFSGNGTGTYRGWIAKQANLRWEGVSALGTSDHKTFHVGNKAVNCTIIEGGGQAMGWQFQKQALIANNIFQDSSGAGFSYCEDSILMGNTATRSHDAPFIANGRCNNIVIANNTSKHTTNGSGIDVVGCSNVIVKGNIIEESAGWGLLVSYSVQQQCASRDILVTGNIFKKNCREISVPMHGEICVGSPYTERDLNAANVVVSDNMIIMDGSRNKNTGRFLVVGHGVKQLTVKDNFISGKSNGQKQALVALLPTRNVMITGNQWSGEGIVNIDLSGGIQGERTVTNNFKMTCVSNDVSTKQGLINDSEK